MHTPSFQKAQGGNANNIMEKNKNKRKCFYYGKMDPYKRNCRHYLATLKKDKYVERISNVCISETNLLVSSSNTWSINSNTSSHFCNTLQGFKESCKYKDGERILKMGTNATIAAVAIGTFILELSNDRTLVLEHCLFILDIHRNLISILKLVSFGYSFFY